MAVSEPWRPFVTVIVPCRNEARLIDRFLASLLDLDYPRHLLEFIFADGMSDDGTRDVLAQFARSLPSATVIDNPGMIVPTGMNLALKICRGEVVVRMDAHSEFPPDYITRCVDLLGRTGAANAGGRVVNIPNGDGPWALAVAYVTASRLGVGNSRWRTSLTPGFVDTVPNGTFRRDVLLAVGMFDERLTRGQDHELNARMRKAGYKVAFDPEIKIRYYNQGTLRGLLRQGFFTSMWNVYNLYLHPYTWRWRRFIPSGFVLYLGGLAGAAALAPRAALLAGVPALLYAALVVAFAWRGRAHGGARRVAATFVLYHVCYGAGGLFGLFNLATGRWRRQLGRPLRVRRPARASWYRRRGKRALDFTASLLGLAALAPVFALAAAAIKLFDPGPVFFRQTRAGQGFKPFRIYKFRSMRVGGAGLQITSGRDRRITPLGSLLRKTKLDELPQLINVLLGDMSLVGPRPTVPKYAEMYRKEYETILSVKPGITDYASVKYRDEEGVLQGYEAPEAGYMDDILPEKMALYRRYISEMSLSCDLRIIFATLARVARVGGKEPAKDAPVRIRVLRAFDRRMAMLTLDLFLVCAAYALACLLHHDLYLSAGARQDLAVTMPYALLSYLGASYYFGVNRGLRYYASFGDVLDASKAAGAAAVLLALAGRAALGAVPPAPALMVWPLLSLCAVCGAHVCLRALSHYFRVQAFGAGERRSAVIVGVGDLAELAYQNMRSHDSLDYRVAAFFDDEPGRCGVRVHGVPVAGGPRALAAVLMEVGVDEIVVAVPRERRAKALRAVADALSLVDRKPEVRVMPSIEEARKTAGPAEPRKVQPADLIQRRGLPIDVERVRAALGGRTVLVTGAGGTIGGELCRQILSYGPKRLVMLDNNASTLFTRETDLRQEAGAAELCAVLGDARDQGILDRVFSEDKPQVVIHAAAHKHVHQLETNIHEGVSNNVMGAYHLAAAAERAGVEVFIHLSTDKAARPKSVMAATKRAAEVVMATFAARSKTRFASVRFGNVLGSSGSVLKIFQEQIERGRPLTITHPEAARYFMTVEEAAGLILQAAAQAKGGEIFALKMDEQIRVMDMARSLVRLSGLDPDTDVQIHYVGLRPGETRAPEMTDEAVDHAPSEHPGIMIVNQTASLEELAKKVLNLELLSWRSDKHAMVRALAELVPAFMGSSNDYANN